MKKIVEFWESALPATEEQIARFEQFLGIQLPQGYRVFLQETNGGHPEPCAFPVQNSARDTHVLVAWLFGLDDQRRTNDLLSQFNGAFWTAGEVLTSYGTSSSVPIIGPIITGIGLAWTRYSTMLYRPEYRVTACPTIGPAYCGQ